MFNVLVLAFALFSFAACIVPAKSAGDAITQKLKSPPGRTPVNANLGNKVKIESIDYSMSKAFAGATVDCTLKFSVQEKLPVDYTIFVHVEYSSGERIVVDHQPQGGARPTSTWQSGEIITDTFSFTVPAPTNASVIRIYAGLWDSATDTRLELINKNEVRNDGANRILLTALPIVK